MGFGCDKDATIHACMIISMQYSFIIVCEWSMHACIYTCSRDVISRVESGSHLLTYTWPTDPQSNPDVTHIWPTYDPLVTHMLKFSSKSYVKLHGKIRYETIPYISSGYSYRTGPIHRILENEISGHHAHASKQLKIVAKLVLHQWWFGAFTRPKVHLLIRCQYLFSNWRTSDLLKIRVTSR